MCRTDGTETQRNESSRHWAPDLERVLVTGATGFLGTQVTRALAAQGFDVYGAARTTPSTQDSISWHQINDLSDRSALRSAVTGKTAIVHLAGRAHVIGGFNADSTAAFRQTNVEGTRALLEEAVRAGVGRFVFISSVKVMGHARTSPFTEKMIPVPADPYGQSKLDAEKLVADFARRYGLNAPIVRLPLVYGPGMKANMLGLFRAVDMGLPLPFASVENARSLVFSGNVSAAIHALLCAGREASDVFFLSDGRDFSTPDLITLIARVLGKRANLFPMPVALLTTIARAGDYLTRMLPFPFNSAAAERLLGSLTVDSTKLVRVTGAPPPFSPEEGMSRSADWFRERFSRK